MTVRFLSTSCSMVKEISSITYTRSSLTPQQAKNEVYATAREIINTISQEIADIQKVDFNYKSENDDGTPPFKAVVTITITTYPQYDNKYISDTYRSTLLKLPGWDTYTNIRSHSPMIYKNDMFIYLPSTAWRTFEINGPLAIYEDLRKTPEHWDPETGSHELLTTEDVTRDFLPPKKYRTI